MNFSEESDRALSELLLNLFIRIGEAFITCDGVMDKRELDDMNSYCSMLGDYVSQNLNLQMKSIAKRKNDTSGLTTTKVAELLNELNSLVGLSSVKEEVKSLINLIHIRKIREVKGIPQPDLSLHLVFTGNPGTGKTMVARLLAEIYHQLGILSSGHLTEVDRSGLVGGYIGQTAIKVQEVIAKAKGGILFIDEAYSLTVNKGEIDFGKEAVDTLLKAMEDNRNDFIVIVAGYPEYMKEFLASNPGLRSRFNRFINFEDYTSNEMVEILSNMCEKAHLYLSEDAIVYAKNFFDKRYMNKSSNFANARDVRNFFEKAMFQQANRLALLSDLDDLLLSEIRKEDLKKIVL